MSIITLPTRCTLAGGIPSRFRLSLPSREGVNSQSAIWSVRRRLISSGSCGRRNADRLELRQLLNSAGYYNTTVAQYLGYRASSIVGLPLVVLRALHPRRRRSASPGFAFTIIAGAIGWILPKSWVEQAARKRTERIDYEVPELVDLLVTTIEAGIGFGSALQLSARRVRDPLGSELRLTLGEQSMGLTMTEALSNMLERTNRSASMRAFVQSIVQGETMGVLAGAHASRPRGRHAQAAQAGGGGAGAEGADQAPVPADVPDPAGDAHRHPRSRGPGDLARARRLAAGLNDLSVEVRGVPMDGRCRLVPCPSRSLQRSLRLPTGSWCGFRRFSRAPRLV